METKNLRKTSGGPLYFGLGGVLLILVSSILQSGVSQALSASILSKVNMNPAFLTIMSVIGLIIYPGIFLILLLVGMNRPKRGTAFSVVWMIVSAIDVIQELVLLITPNVELLSLSNQLVPGGFYLYMIIGLVGNLLILVSCILLLKRLHQPADLS